MTEATFNPALFGALAPFIGKRFYLRGVYIAPAPSGPGIILAATDGRRALLAYDRSGIAPEPLILPCPKDIVAACKVKPSQAQRARAHFTPGTPGTLEIRESDRPISPTFCLDPINATYPDILRVVRKAGQESTDSAVPPFNARLLKGFEPVASLDPGTTALGLTARARGMDWPIAIETMKSSSPALIHFDPYLPFFGLLMPLVSSNKLSTGLPEWLQPAQKTPTEETPT